MKFNKDDLRLVQKRIEPSLPIKPGAAVMLNSGGPNMLVRDIVNNICGCIWIHNKTVVAGDFNIVCLTLLGDVNVLIR